MSDEMSIGTEDVATVDAATLADPVDIWADEHLSDELKAAYAERAQLAEESEALRERKRANSEQIRALEAAHVEQHSAGGEPQVIQGDIPAPPAE